MLNKKRNTNCKIVIIKADRICMHCKEIIPKNTKCLTINTRRNKRQWMCLKCKTAYDNMVTAKAMNDTVSFGDEGGAWAMSDYYDEKYAEFWDRKVD